MAVLAAAVVGFFLPAARPSRTTDIVLVVAVAGAILVLASAGFGADLVTRRLYLRLGALRSAITGGEEDLWRVVERVKNGERFAPLGTEAPSAEEADPFVLLADDLRRAQRAAQNAVLQASRATSVVATPDRRVQVFVNLARRMQSSVHREIQLLDELEAKVEDPDLLKGLFAVDHLATRMRRQSESLAVLGGARSRRQWSSPVNMYEVLRSAVAEVEQYSRVKVVPPVEGTLDGGAVADVIHLIAELIENATKFSPPNTQVLLRAQNVAAGLAIEVEDRGLGMPFDEQLRMNELLAEPGRVNIDELLYDGRIGLYVVSALARRHGIRIQLRSNIYAGLQAVIVLPGTLINPRSRNERDRGPAESPATTPDDQRPPLPARDPSSARDTAVRFRRPGSHRRMEGGDGERPPLPERRAQTHLAPRLRDVRLNQQEELAAEHTPGLMAAFQGGVSRAEEGEGNDPSGPTDSIS